MKKLQVTEEMMRKQEFFLKFRTPFSDLEAEILWALIRNGGCLCISATCRAVNGFRPDEYVCHKKQVWHGNRRFYFGAKDRYKTTEACNQQRLGCCIPFMIVRKALYRMEQKGILQHETTIFWDHGRKGKNMDKFTFYFAEREAYEEKVLSQSLVPYVCGNNVYKTTGERLIQ